MGKTSVGLPYKNYDKSGRLAVNSFPKNNVGLYIVDNACLITNLTQNGKQKAFIGKPKRKQRSPSSLERDNKRVEAWRARQNKF